MIKGMIDTLPSGRFIVNENYILRDIAGQSVLVSIGSEIADFCGVINLNATAKELWTVLQDGATKEELVKTLTDKFSVSDEQADEDVTKTLLMLIERGMITNE